MMTFAKSAFLGAIVATLASMAFSFAAYAQVLLSPEPPSVTVTASATASVANDRMHAWLRSEIDNPDPAKAASEVNTRIAKALARAKAVPGVEVTTSGYSSFQVTEKNQPPRWRVTQSLFLEASDFATLAALVSRLQGEDGLLLSGLSFSVSEATRRKTEDALTQQAIKAWQARAKNAADGLGFPAWRVGKVAIQTGDHMPPRPLQRSAGVAYAASAAPVAVEGGNSDITVTVSGDAVLETLRR